MVGSMNISFTWIASMGRNINIIMYRSNVYVLGERWHISSHPGNKP